VGVGAALLLLGVLVTVIELYGARRWGHFFEVFGRNTLFLYLTAELGMAVLWITEWQGKSTMLWLFERFIEPWAGSKPGGLVYALLFMALVWCVGWWMDRRRIYIRL